MTWTGWACCSGRWLRLAEADTIGGAVSALADAQHRQGCWNSLHGVVTGGRVPNLPVVPGRCLSHAQASPKRGLAPLGRRRRGRRQG